jgi:hypothetical protein
MAPPDENFVFEATPMHELAVRMVGDGQGALVRNRLDNSEQPNPSKDGAGSGPKSATSPSRPLAEKVAVQRKILSPKEWARQNFPQLAGKKFVTPQQYEVVDKGYKQYVAMEQNAQQEDRYGRGEAAAERRHGEDVGLRREGLELQREGMNQKTTLKPQDHKTSLLDVSGNREMLYGRLGLVTRMKQATTPAEKYATYTEMETYLDQAAATANPAQGVLLRKVLAQNRPTKDDYGAMLAAGVFKPTEQELQAALNAEDADYYAANPREPRPSGSKGMAAGPIGGIIGLLSGPRNRQTSARRAERAKQIEQQRSAEFAQRLDELEN